MPRDWSHIQSPASRRPTRASALPKSGDRRCCAGVAAQQVEYLEPHRVGIEISRDDDDWIAEYSFNRPVDGWFFPRSSLAREGQIAWRQRDWTVETPGVKLTRRGHYDVLESERGGMPAKVRVRFKPFTGMSAFEQDSYLRAWMESGLGMQRQGFLALNKISGMLFYMDARTWPQIGYPGPWVGRFDFGQGLDQQGDMAAPVNPNVFTRFSA